MVTQRDLAKVARIYIRAIERGEAPAKAVSVQLGMPMATANNWIRRAKDRGLLEDGLWFRPHRNAKAVRVAEVLGVEYDDLIAAVREHANGDLRVGL